MSTIRLFAITVTTCIVAAVVAACTAPLSALDAKEDRDQTSATGDGGTGTQAGDHDEAVQVTNGIPCAVNDVLAKNCQTCHGATPTSGASTALMTWEDLQKDHGGKKLYDVVKDRIHAEAGRMPPAARLSDAQIKSVDDWVTGGAEKASGTCTTNAPAPTTRPFVCDAPNKRIELKSPKPFTWTKDIPGTDEYMCFGVDVSVASKEHIIAMGPLVQNLNIVHHILVFQAKDAYSPEPKKCGTTETGAWKLVTGWAPGGGNLILPPEAGYPQENTVHWVMQIHYNNASNKFVGETDNTGYQFCTSNQLRPNDAGTLAFGSHGFTIPPRVARWTQRCDYKLGERYKGRKFFGASPHMHTLGLAISTEKIPGGTGAPEMIFKQDPFSFENQDDFKIDASVAPGDIMRTRCTFKNPRDIPVKWGENTGDEMCFNFIQYYPAIPDFTIGPVPVQSWVSPSLNDIFPMLVKCEEEN